MREVLFKQPFLPKLFTVGVLSEDSKADSHDRADLSSPSCPLCPWPCPVLVVWTRPHCRPCHRLLCCVVVVLFQVILDEQGFKSVSLGFDVAMIFGGAVAKGWFVVLNCHNWEGVLPLGVFLNGVRSSPVCCLQPICFFSSILLLSLPKTTTSFQHLVFFPLACRFAT